MIIDKLGHGASRFGTLVSTNWLREQISAVASGVKLPLRVVDCSATHDSTLNGYEAFYQQSHIPMAVYFSIHKLCPPQPDVLQKYPIPDINRFQDVVESLGIDEKTHVISYDRANSSFAFKTWWLFRLFGHKKVSVLDGGFLKWLKDGFEVTVEEPKIVRSTFQPKFSPELLRDFDQMAKNIQTKAEQAVDPRSPASFKNDRSELKPDVVAGHIPGSVNIPYETLFEEDGTFKLPPELKKVFDEANVDLTKPLVASCQTGMTACGIAAAAHVLGKEVVPVYCGSFHEWGQRASPDQIAFD